MLEIAKKIPWSRIGAESAVIVVSILLAFSIDAWHEQRADRALEEGYLHRIGDELKDAKAMLESILLEVNGNVLFVPDLNEFFDGRMAAGDHQRLVVAIYKFGLDPLEVGFDVSTFADLVSTGRLSLISDAEVRQAIQRAYAQLQRLAPIRAPYRSEYMAALRGWIPRSVSNQIRAACPEHSPYSACSDLDLDDKTVRSIVEQIDTREALLAFQIRETGLATLNGIGEQVMAALDQALARLER